MKVYVSRVPQRGPWGGGNRWLIALFAALQRHTIDVVSSPTQADVIVAAGVEDGNATEPGVVALCRYAAATNKKVLFRVNDCDARKNTTHINQAIFYGCKLATKIVFVSNWLQNHLDVDKAFMHKSIVLINGVDDTIFKPVTRTLCDRLRIVTHHWSDNRLKGAEWYEALDKMTIDDKVDFTYVGRHKCSFVGNTKCLPPLDGLALAKELADHDLYVSGSVYDPGPNHIIEAVSCGLPIIVNANGGACVEFSEGLHVAQNEHDLISIIKLRKFLTTSRKFQTWESCAEQYVAEIKKL
ncbi:MAG: hypothetical protein E6Q36_04225 [Chryseobacterium sp.]|nr:MAG: hypothetical protein E6Q36_04225 [Chryseobacterium sp.]